MINSVVLTGRLAKDVVAKDVQTKNGLRHKVWATLAVDSNSKAGATAFVSIVAWANADGRGPAASLVGKKKGELLGIQGSLETSSYTDQSGKTIYSMDVLVNNVTFLETKAQSQARAAQSAQANAFAGTQQQAPSQSQGNAFGAPAQNQGNAFGTGANQGGQQAPAQGNPFGQSAPENDGFNPFAQQ